MAAKKSNPAMEFIVAALTKNPSATYKEIADAAGKKRLKIYPIMYGRAQTMLGIVKAAPRGQGKAARKKAGVDKAAAAKAGVQKRGPGRPRKSAPAAPAIEGTIEGIVAAVKHSEQAKARYRRALERIQEVLAEALAD